MTDDQAARVRGGGELLPRAHARGCRPPARRRVAGALRRGLARGPAVGATARGRDSGNDHDAAARLAELPRLSRGRGGAGAARAGGLRLVVASNWDASLDTCSTPLVCSTPSTVSSRRRRPALPSPTRGCRRAPWRWRAWRRAPRCTSVTTSARMSARRSAPACDRFALPRRSRRPGRVRRRCVDVARTPS